jgi:hypothetical protein
VRADDQALTPLALGPSQLLIVYGSHSEQLRNYFSNGFTSYHYKGSRYKLNFVLQEPALGTAHALLQCPPHLNDRTTHLLVMPADAPLVTASQLSRLVAGALNDQREQRCRPAGARRSGRVRQADDSAWWTIVETQEAGEAGLAVTEVSTRSTSLPAASSAPGARGRLGASRARASITCRTSRAWRRGRCCAQLAMPIESTTASSRPGRQCCSSASGAAGCAGHLPPAGATYIHGDVALAPTGVGHIAC